ncbi:MAG: cytochrome c3 family protein [Rhodocyclaceae bacterium]|nr:cytochrome c3 family protein [Rhodocyclaceae bacterium]MDZ4215534.1 cytochrome c3 family protein [Rhodocyclaceae bacterium]
MKRLIGVVAIMLGLGFAPAWAGSHGGQPPVGAQCLDCHEAEVKSHGKHAYHGDCVSCHTSAVDHAKAETAKESAPKGSRPESINAGLPKSEQCLSCHKNDAKHMNFAFSDHAKANVQCRDCHGSHTPKIKSLTAGMQKAGKDAALCVSCHKDVQAKFNLRSHHPLREGGVSCKDCHDPHGGKQLTLAGKTTQCTQCHQNVRGPHAFEHAPAVEDCATCHNPHGTPNPKLLNLAQPMLCLQCHSVPGNRHGNTGLGTNGQTISATALRNCSSCHNAPHGSHMDQHLRF